MGMDVLLFLFLTATPMKENTNLINDMALKYRWNDGRIYDGQFSEDKRHGKGVLAFPRKASKLSCGAAGNLILLRIRLHVIITIVVATSSVS
mmetsp:Transcript_16753/g.40056  ORF Transcript_16753/g.40056 Transcript_16753/m.40056 type:complete len:92 (+) Transcript_16753:1373-1648(+)